MAKQKHRYLVIFSHSIQYEGTHTAVFVIDAVSEADAVTQAIQLGGNTAREFYHPHLVNELESGWYWD